MQPRSFLPILSIALATLASSAFAADLPAKRVAEGTIEGYVFYVEILDARKPKTTPEKSNPTTHRIAFVVSDEQDEMVRDAKAEGKLVDPEGKVVTLDAAYDDDARQIGEDLSLSKPGKYHFEGNLLLNEEKKAIAFEYNVK